MDPSDHSSNFNSAQMATDQREGSDALSGQTVPSSVASYQTNSPPRYNPCSLDNWSRYISQPLYVSSGLPSHFYPQILGTESYNMDMSHHPLDAGPHSYLDHHDIPSHIHAVMDSPDLGPMGEVKPEYVHEDQSDWRTFRTSALKEELYYHTPGVLHSVPHAPPSPPSTASSYASPDSGPAPSPARTTQGLISRNPKEERPGNQPYSVLIYRALKGADGNKLSLQGIYRWFEEHTDKAKDPNHKGWQNSIRHNLSMNAGFEAVKEDVRPGEKPANFWRLTSEAIKDGGIQSTTRYRKGSAKGAGRGSQREPPQSKGGQPPKKIKTGTADNQANSRVEMLGQDYATTELPPMNYMPQVFASGHPSVNHFMPRFSMGPVSGCTAQFPGNNGVFIDGPEMGPDYGPTYAIGHGWYAPSPVPNDRAVAGSNVPAGPMLDCKDQ
ncbi:unnamed protein product [Penicillium salamii]|nr:unnamed protein product [Penicillium salamii]